MTEEPHTTRLDLAGRPAESGWLTITLRPAGVLDSSALGTLSCSLDDLAAVADMLVVDLDAARVTEPAALCAALRDPAWRLARPGRCLLLVNVTAEVDTAVRDAGLPVATLPANHASDRRAARLVDAA